MTARTTLDLRQIHRSEPESYDYNPNAATDETRAWFARQKFEREQERAKARALYEQAERDYHHHNRTLDGQA